MNPDDTAPPQDIPPDLVVEVDITSSSRSRLQIYQAMGVPEIWRYDRRGWQILHLSPGGYVECADSPTFPLLSTAVLAQRLEQGKQSNNHNQFIRELRTWLRDL